MNEPAGSRRDEAFLLSAIVMAGGSSSRMGEIDKLFYPLVGVPALLYSLQTFQDIDRVGEIILVCREDRIAEAGALCREYGLDKVKVILRGGSNRSESVERGLAAVDDRFRFVAVHDGARPFVSEKIVLDTLHAAMQHGAAAPAVSLKDTVKVRKNGMVEQTLERDSLCAVQTPQIFLLDRLREAYRINGTVGFTDDCSLVEALGYPVALVEGSAENFKITTPEDLILAEEYAKKLE